MRDQSGKCILQHVSQSIGTPSVMHCVGIERRKEGGRKRKKERGGRETIGASAETNERRNTLGGSQMYMCVCVCLCACARVCVREEN